MSITDVVLVIVYQLTTVMALKTIQDSFKSSCGKLRYPDKTTRYFLTYGDVGYKEGCFAAYSNLRCEQRLPVCANFIRFQLPCPGGRRLILVLLNKHVTNRTEYDCSSGKPPTEYCGQHVYLFLKSDPWLPHPYYESGSTLQISVTCTSRADTDNTSLNIGVTVIIPILCIIFILASVIIIRVKRKRKRLRRTSITNLLGETSIRSNSVSNINVRNTAIPNEYVQMENNSRTQDHHEQEMSSIITQQSVYRPEHQVADHHSHRVVLASNETATRMETNNVQRTNSPRLETVRVRHFNIPRQETARSQHLNRPRQENIRDRHSNRPREEATRDEHMNILRTEINRERHPNILSNNQFPHSANLTASLPYHYCHLHVTEGHLNTQSREIIRERQTFALESHNQNLLTDNPTVSLPYHYCHLQVTKGHDNLL